MCHLDAGEGKCLHYFSGETLGKGSVGRPRRRWENKTKRDAKEVGWENGLY